jgi:hypothetical protein
LTQPGPGGDDGLPPAPLGGNGKEPAWADRLERLEVPTPGLSTHLSWFSRRARKERRTSWTRREMLTRRRTAAVLLMVLAILVVCVGASLGSALTNPAFGQGANARFAEWAREHGAGGVVTWAENEWYLHHQPPKGGAPPKGAIPQAKGTTPTNPVATVAHLTPPAPLVPPVSPALAGEGSWSPAGRTVEGLPAVYEAFVRDPVYTSYVTGIAWMDTKLLDATLYSGSQIPGGGPWPNSAPITTSAATSLVAAFNAGFQLSDSQGGYYTNGQAVAPLRNGSASIVIYADGTITVAQWGRDAFMAPNVVSVRQNLALLVDNGAVVPGLNANDNQAWGATLAGAAAVWRSGLGVTAQGALVYAGGPALTITALANMLVMAGCVRGMELDINTDWVQYSTYNPSPIGSPASQSNGTSLLSNMSGNSGQYFASYWSRDFFTMSAISNSAG